MRPGCPRRRRTGLLRGLLRQPAAVLQGAIDPALDRRKIGEEAGGSSTYLRMGRPGIGSNASRRRGPSTPRPGRPRTDARSGRFPKTLKNMFPSTNTAGCPNTGRRVTPATLRNEGIERGDGFAAGFGIPVPGTLRPALAAHYADGRACPSRANPLRRPRAEGNGRVALAPRSARRRGSIRSGWAR